MEAYRLTSLAAESLRRIGVERPRDHIMVIRGPEALPDIAYLTILVSPQPFSVEDVGHIVEVAEDLAFEVRLAPNVGLANGLRVPESDPIFVEIAQNDLQRMRWLPTSPLGSKGGCEISSRTWLIRSHFRLKSFSKSWLKQRFSRPSTPLKQ